MLDALRYFLFEATSISAGISCSDQDTAAYGTLQYAITAGNDNGGLIPFQIGSASGDISVDNPVGLTR